MDTQSKGSVGSLKRFPHPFLWKHLKNCFVFRWYLSFTESPLLSVISFEHNFNSNSIQTSIYKTKWMSAYIEISSLLSIFKFKTLFYSFL